MKPVIFSAALAAIMLSAAPVLAQQSPTGDKGAEVKSTAPNVADFDKQLAQAQENMKKMQEQMDKLSKTQDPQERQKLLQEHWTAMQAGMGMMDDMMAYCMNGPMMGGHMMGGHMMSGNCCMGGSGMGSGMMMGGGHMMGWQDSKDYYAKLTPEQTRQRQYMMDRYMGMQQMMMGHMMQHQEQMRKNGDAGNQ